VKQILSIFSLVEYYVLVSLLNKHEKHYSMQKLFDVEWNLKFTKKVSLNFKEQNKYSKIGLKIPKG
jgi:hypothetical protein